VKPWLFPQVMRIAGEWYESCVELHDNTFKQLLYFAENAADAAGKIYQSIAASQAGAARLRPLVHAYDPVQSTRHVDFDTTRPVYVTRADKCHISHVVCDTGSWEQKLAQALEEMDEVICYVKNDRQPGFVIPYVTEGDDRSYYPDFVARVDDGLNLILEVTGEKKKDKEAKVATASTLWVPAVNNHGSYGRWAFVEIPDPWNAQTTIRAAISRSLMRENDAEAFA
jgi:type III restriction enzyme